MKTETRTGLCFSAALLLALIAGAPALADERTAVQQPEGTGYDSPRAGIGPRGDYPPALEESGTVEEGAETIEEEDVKDAEAKERLSEQESDPRARVIEDDRQRS